MPMAHKTGAASGFPRWCSSKEPPASAGDLRNMGLIPGLGRCLGGGHGNPFQYFCLEYPMDRGAWKAIVHWVAEHQTQLKQRHAHPQGQALHIQSRPLQHRWSTVTNHIGTDSVKPSLWWEHHNWNFLTKHLSYYRSNNITKFTVCDPNTQVHTTFCSKRDKGENCVNHHLPVLYYAGTYFSFSPPLQKTSRGQLKFTLLQIHFFQ